MKSIIFFFIFLPVALLAQSQTPPPPTDSLFIITYTTGPAWDKSKNPGDQPWFKEHSANLGKMRKDGIIKLGARHGEKGMIVLSVASREAAANLVFNDPAVVNKLFNAELEKLSVFYFGCLEKPK